jgi:hypothetical protein
MLKEHKSFGTFAIMVHEQLPDVKLGDLKERLHSYEVILNQGHGMSALKLNTCYAFYSK